MTCLTGRDRELLALLCRGLVDKEIARRLGIKPASVTARVGRMCVRLGARTRAHAVYLALQLADVQPSPRPIPPVVRVPHDPPEVIAERRAVLLGTDEESG